MNFVSSTVKPLARRRAVRHNEKSDSVTARAVAVLEHISNEANPVSVPDLIRALALPKPTVHRLCSSLQQLGLLQREPGGKRLAIGPRLSSIALRAMMNSPDRGARHAILRSVVDATGETCTLTILDGDQVLCLDRVESDSPLRMELHAGSRVPLHCTASGKLFLAMLPRVKRRRLIGSIVLLASTDRTITDPGLLERELEEIRKERVGRDNQEFLAGLVAVAVPVLDKAKRTCATISINAPAARMSLQQARRHVPTLRKAADLLAQTLANKGPESDELGSKARKPSP